MKLRSLGSLGTCVLFAAIAACSSSSTSGGATADGGAPPAPPPETPPSTDGAADACVPGSLPSAGKTQIAAGEKTGLHTTMTLDDTGAPVVAYLTDDGTGSATSITLSVIRWQAQTCTWSAPIVVDQFGYEEGNGRQVQLATDAADGTIGLAWLAVPGKFGENEHYEIRYAELKKGESKFSQPEHVEDQKDNTHGPSAPGVGLSHGKAYVAWHQDYRLCGTSGCEAMIYRVRSGPGQWSGEIEVPDAGARDGNTSIAIDADGKPAMAWQETVSHPGTGGVYFKTRFLRLTEGDDAGAAPTSTVIMANDDVTGTDAPWVELAFDGKKPRAVVIMNKDASWASDGKTEWFVASDDGVTWGAPVALPHDKGSSLDLYASIAIGAGGKVVIASESNQSDGTHVFGQPKLLTTTNLTDFTVGGVPRDVNNDGAHWVAMKIGKDGKVQLAWKGNASNDPTEMGVQYWREQ